MGNLWARNNHQDAIESLRSSLEEKERLLLEFEQRHNVDEQQSLTLENRLSEVQGLYEHEIKELKQENKNFKEECEQNKNRVISLEQEHKDIQEKYEKLCIHIQELEREKEEIEGKSKVAINHLNQEKENLQSQIHHMVIASEECTKQQKLVRELSVTNEEQMDKIAMLQRELHDKSDELLETQESIKEEKVKLLSMTAASHQARKLYGDTMPGDITHANVANKYLEFFKHYLRNLPRQNPSIDRLVVQQTLAKLFQTTYECGCKELLDLFKHELGEVLDLQCGESDLERDHDIASAFSLLSYHVKERKECIEQLKSNIHKDIKDALTTDIMVSDDLLDKAIDIVINMLILTPPQVMGMPSAFSEDLHEIRSNNWTDCEDDSYELIYFRPVLYHGRNGAVAVQGLVGNILPHNTD